MDINILYEHEERELYNSYLLKFELEKRGYDVEISKLIGGKIPSFKIPKLIVMPWFTSNDHIDIVRFLYLGRIKKVLNLQYEQVISKVWIDKGHHCPSGLTKKACVICWGDKTKKRFEKVGVSEKKQ